MPNYKITLDGRNERSSGDVFTRDGEVIGTWTADENDFYEFFPDGEEKSVIQSYVLGVFCLELTDWHEKQTAPNR